MIFLIQLFRRNKVKEVTFIPYAKAKCKFNEYTQMIADVLVPWGFSVKGLHTAPDPAQAVDNAQCIFIAGGNTFLLLKTLYDLQLIDPIRKNVLENGVPFMGSSAGTNVATPSIHTTNDMPIVYPPRCAAENCWQEQSFIQ